MLRALVSIVLFALAMPAAAYCVPPPPPPCQVGQPCPPPAPTYTLEDQAAYDGFVVAASTRAGPGAVSPTAASQYAMRVITLRRTFFAVPGAPVAPDAPPLRSHEEPLYVALVEAMTAGVVAGAPWSWFSPNSFASQAHNAAWTSMQLRRGLLAAPGC